MTNSVGNESRDDVCHAIPRIPPTLAVLHLSVRESRERGEKVFLPRRLLIASVKHANDEGKARRNGGLGHAEEEAGCHEPSKALRSSVAHQDSSP